MSTAANASLLKLLLKTPVLLLTKEKSSSFVSLILNAAEMADLMLVVPTYLIITENSLGGPGLLREELPPMMSGMSASSPAKA